MLYTIEAVVRAGKIELLEPARLPEGKKLLITLLPDEEDQFWQGVSPMSLVAVWNNKEDDIYAELLEK